MCLLCIEPSICLNSGRIFIVSAPSGAGKTTLSRIVCNRMPGLIRSVSYTTRSPRKGEVDETDYYFISEEEFIRGIEKGTWVEWAEVHGNLYGTSLHLLRSHLASGNDVLLDIDIQGTKSILGKYPDAITVFVMPPSLKTLEKRLRGRGTDSDNVVNKRLQNAEFEIKEKNLYKYVVINDNLEEAVNKIIDLFQGSSKKRF